MLDKTKARRRACKAKLQRFPTPGEIESEQQYAAAGQPLAAFSLWMEGHDIPPQSCGPVPGHELCLPYGSADGHQVPLVGPGLGVGCVTAAGRRTGNPYAPGGVPTWAQGNDTPPIQSQPVEVCSAAPTVVGDAVYVTVLQYRVPPRHNLVIKRFGFSAESAAAENDVTWQVVVNSTPLAGAGVRACPFGSYRDLRPVNWRLQGRDLFRVRFISNTVGVNHSICANAHGWIYPPGVYNSDLIETWRGA